MTKPPVDREELKEAVRELLRSEPSLFVEVLREFRNELHKGDRSVDRTERIRTMIDEDFAELDEVFRALS